MPKEKPKKVKVEVVDDFGEPIKKKTHHKSTSHSIHHLFEKAKLIIAIILDFIDFFTSMIPVLNTIWDFITYFILSITLKHKYLAYVSLGELLIPGIGSIGLIDGVIPSATILTLIDIALTRIKK